MKWPFLLIFCASTSLPIGEHRIQTLFEQIPPNSLKKNVLFARLFPLDEHGIIARKRIFDLLDLSNATRLAELENSNQNESEEMAIEPVNFSNESLPSTLSEKSFFHFDQIISSLSSSFHDAESTVLEKLPYQVLEKKLQHFRLKGHKITSIQELDTLADEEIDLSRALFLVQYETELNCLSKVLQSEAKLDWMALQIATSLPAKPSQSEIASRINDFLFYEEKYRFPPHSKSVESIDLYTFLPAVMDEREGVCLGVSILYLCLAQRLGLVCEVITPPGHIYLRIKETQKNIETTARGIHLPTDAYLGIDLKELNPRTIKEVIGMMLVNQAAPFLHKGLFENALELYEKSEQFMPTDPTLRLLKGVCLYLLGQYPKATQHLHPLNTEPLAGHLEPDRLASDLFYRKATKKALKAAFTGVDETRESLQKKIQKLEKAMVKCPQFRYGLLQLAVCHLQLGCDKKGLEILERYHQIDPTDPIVQYYLSALYLERAQFDKSHACLAKLKAILASFDHHPKVVDHLNWTLSHVSPQEITLHK